MSRSSRADAELNRQAITQASAKLFKERGFKDVTVAELMAAAGMTHGGFYVHFDSKEALASEAVGHAFAESVARRIKASSRASSKQVALKQMVDAYLSARTRSDPGSSCPTAALATDVGREPESSPVRQAFEGGFQELVDFLTGLEETGDSAADRAKALGDLATMVGGLILARATSGSALSDELLAAARARIAV